MPGQVSGRLAKPSGEAESIRSPVWLLGEYVSYYAELCKLGTELCIQCILDAKK